MIAASFSVFVLISSFGFQAGDFRTKLRIIWASH